MLVLPFLSCSYSQYYGALVGTLEAAKRKVLIELKGQMLSKGMHDDVRIVISN